MVADRTYFCSSCGEPCDAFELDVEASVFVTGVFAPSTAQGSRDDDIDAEVAALEVKQQQAELGIVGRVASLFSRRDQRR